MYQNALLESSVINLQLTWSCSRANASTSDEPAAQWISAAAGSPLSVFCYRWMMFLSMGDSRTTACCNVEKGGKEVLGLSFASDCDKF